MKRSDIFNIVNGLFLAITCVGFLLIILRFFGIDEIDKEDIKWIIGLLVPSLSGIFMQLIRNKENKEVVRIDNKLSIKTRKDPKENRFIELLNKMEDDVKKGKIKDSLAKIEKAGFPVDLYEIQIEEELDNLYDRRLRTICSNYVGPAHIAPIKRLKRVFGIFNKTVYTGQTTYAFDKNKDMWIIDKNGELLAKQKNPNAEYIDELHPETVKQDRIPDFWVMDDEMDEKIKTLAIFQLRCVGRSLKSKYSNFGFISFGSNKHVQCNVEIKEEFENIANFFAMDFIEQGMS